jgi:hypothetical protein
MDLLFLKIHGAFFRALPEKTGLSAPIQRILLRKIRKDFRFYPLRGQRCEPRAAHTAAKTHGHI